MRNDISLIHEKLNLLKEKQMVEQKVLINTFENARHFWYRRMKVPIAESGSWRKPSEKSDELLVQVERHSTQITLE